MTPTFNGQNREYNKRQSLYESQNHRCAYCGVRFHLTKKHIDIAPSIDHVIPIIDGGLRQWENEVAACRWCNNVRSDTDAFAFYEALVQIRAERAAAGKRGWRHTLWNWAKHEQATRHLERANKVRARTLARRQELDRELGRLSDPEPATEKLGTWWLSQVKAPS